MYLNNVIDAQGLSALEILIEKMARKKDYSTTFPMVSINSLEHLTTYTNGKLALRVSVKIDRKKINLEEFQEFRKIISPKEVIVPKRLLEPVYNGSSC